MRLAPWLWLTLPVLLTCGCGRPQAKRDAVSAAMRQAVASSPARVRVLGRTDWEVASEQGTYWVRARLQNQGGPGLVAVRAAIKAMAPYVGIGVSPTEPQYFQMAAGETRELQFTGRISSGAADRALGCALEVYPQAAARP